MNETAATLQSLTELLSAQSGDTLPPVDNWNPPYCGDIGMAIKSDGTWFYQGSPIGRKPLVRLFSRVLRRDPDGRHYLVTPVEKIDVTVDDAPFLAVEMQIQHSGRDQTLLFRTNVDDIVICGPDHPLRFVEEPASGGLKPYILVRGRLQALVTRALYYDIVELAIQNDAAPSNAALANTDGETLGIWSAGRFFPLKAEVANKPDASQV